MEPTKTALNIEIKSIDWKETIAIRHKVLWPNKAPEFCFVDGDEDALHYGAYIDDILVSVASIYQKEHQARLRKFATLQHHQGKGIGSKLLNHILKELLEGDSTYFWCDARESALGFYQQFGLEKEEPRFYKSDISYYKMFKYL